MKALLAVVVLLTIVALASLAHADGTSVVYPPSDGGTVNLPATANRKALAIFNPFDVAICVLPTGSTICWPVAPGAPLYLDVSDSHKYRVSLCSGAATVSCLPSADAGVVTLEVQ
jgi:hypothetical protein